MNLRPIQQNALDAVIQSFRDGGTYHLVQAPVAFGKTILASALMEKSFSEFGAKCLFLAHLTELVVQTVEKLKAVAPDLNFGVCCGSLGKAEVKAVTVGTRQTIAKNLDLFEKVNLIIIDEVHLYSDQYQAIVDHFLAKNPRLRVLGVTGTPYTSKGWMYGEDSIWPEPCFVTTIDAMIELGYLSPYRYLMVDDVELDQIKTSGEDYNEDQLGEMMQEERHMGSVAHAIEKHCQGRERIMVFGVTIEHAEALAQFLGCECVHSKLKKDVWRKRVDDFKRGIVRVLVNVSQLSVGFDCPEVDAIIVARPTLAPALHVQIAGRGLRIGPEKKDCLIVDLVGNYLRHGLPSAPKVRQGKESEEAMEREAEERRASVCHDCLNIVEEDVEVCPHCGADMARKREVKELNEELRLKEIETERAKPRLVRWWEKSGHETKQGNRGSLLIIKLSNREKPLFRFCGDGTKKLIRELAKLENLKPGQPVEIIKTGFGEWIA